jgi:hypothetical protein
MDAEAAKKSFEEGRRLFGEGKHEAAADAFNEAVRNNNQEPSYRANRGTARLALGCYAQAANDLAEALEKLEDSGAQPDKLAAVRQGLETAAREAGAVKVTANVEATIWLDEENVGNTSMRRPIYAAPGHRRLKLASDGHDDVVVDVTLEKGKVEPVKVQLKPKAALRTTVPRPDPGSTEDDGDGAFPIWPAFIAGGLCVAGFVAGGVAWAVADGTDGDADSLQDELAMRTGRPTESTCIGQTAPDIVSDCAELGALRDQAEDQRAGAIAGFVVGGAFAAATIGLLIPSLVSDGSNESARSGPAVTLSMVGISVHGSF